MYQRIRMEDEKGGQMGVTIYGDDIASYAEAIKCREEYEISDAVVKPLKRQFPLRPEKYKMEFTHRVIIQSLFTETDMDDVPDYCAISQINHATWSTEIYGVASFVEPLRTIYAQDDRKEGGREVPIREIIIVDKSYKGKETLIVSVWNDLATGTCEELVSMVESFPVVSLTALKISRRAGFSLSTTMSTLMNLHPGGEKAEQLLKWSFENASHLKSLREAVEGAKVSVKKAVLRSISDFKAMKNLDKKMIRLYLGCDARGTKTYEDIGTKMIFQFDLVDITGSWNVTLFSDDASKVLSIEPDKLYRMEYEDREKFYAEVTKVLARKSIYIKFKLGATFAMSRILKWVMKEVSLDEPAK
ncbi:hypothetical protein Cgig2_030274 [Carnegiea gigantea]|uniref:Uncharacterized protein n=1 Tax=Carnegiea gigantea TaxID=171969 RepID=A0A9Q1JIU2_9CARY|nr:hypothetical protein Cgig2_030274 [Carnegiea gigantea]